jgi:excisionase family DNA binding protein
MNEQTFLTVAECAELLRTTPKAVYTLVERRHIPAVHIGRRLLFNREKVIAWLERGAR